MLRMAKCQDELHHRSKNIYVHKFYTNEKGEPLAIIENDDGSVESVPVHWIRFIDLPSKMLKTS